MGETKNQNSHFGIIPTDINGFLKKNCNKTAHRKMNFNKINKNLSQSNTESNCKHKLKRYFCTIKNHKGRTSRLTCLVSKIPERLKFYQ